MKSNFSKIGSLSVTMLFLGIQFQSNCQNLKKPVEIARMGFEKLKDGENLTEIQSIEIVDNGVSSPTAIKADLFSKSSSGDVGVPINLMGIEDPIKETGGENYAGIYAFKPGKAAVERTYVTIPIMKGKQQLTLKKGLTYCIEFSVSLAESSKFASNNLAAYLTKEKPANGESGPIYSNERVMKGQDNKIVNGFFGWEKICNIYTAKGDEKFITIGNFDKNETTQYTTVKKPKGSEIDQLAHAYYYIDEIIISSVNKPEECPCYNASPKKLEQTYSTLIYTNSPEITPKMTLDEKISAHEVYFRFGKASHTDNAKEMMNYIVEEMKANPDIKIEVQGNRDGVEAKAAESNPDYEEMDRKRAASVVKYLVAQGIEAGRLVEVYNGANVSNPKIDEELDDTETKDAKNRRVSFRIIR
jgi:outer membrane protein OmpA-like peptidoglycan-associated protein